MNGPSSRPPPIGAEQPLDDLRTRETARFSMHDDGPVVVDKHETKDGRVERVFRELRRAVAWLVAQVTAILARNAKIDARAAWWGTTTGRAAWIVAGALLGGLALAALGAALAVLSGRK